MGTKGTLKLRIKTGESIYLGDSEVKVESVSESGWSVNLVVIADKSVKITRKKNNPATLFEQFAPDDSIGNR